AVGEYDGGIQPLGEGLEVDEKMERGREWHTLAHAAIPRQQRPPAAAPSKDSEVLRTAVVPRPALPPGPSGAPMQPAAPPGDWGIAGPAREGNLDAGEDYGPLRLPAV